MAKKQTLKANASSIENTSCPVIKKNKAKLTKAQTDFNSLNKKIISLKENIREMPEREKAIVEFYQEHVSPLFDKQVNMKYDLLLYLDKTYETTKLTAKDRDSLVGLIVEEGSVLMDSNIPTEALEKIKEIVAKYMNIATGLSEKEREQLAIQEALRMFPLLGFKVTPKMKKAKTERELLAAADEFMRSEYEKEMKAEEKKQARKMQKETEQTRRKPTKKELELQLEEERTMKSIREIYIELVKELHPDKEMNDEIRALKEERMKRLTEAYQAKDLASLLSMQINWLEESVKDPSSQTDEVLKQYNKVLRSQLDLLENEYYLLCRAPFPAVTGSYCRLRDIPLKKLQPKLKNLYYFYVAEIDDTQNYVEEISTLTKLKKYLKKFAKSQKEAQEKEELMGEIFKMFL